MRWLGGPSGSEDKQCPEGTDSKTESQSKDSGAGAGRQGGVGVIGEGSPQVKRKLDPGLISFLSASSPTPSWLGCHYME